LIKSQYIQTINAKVKPLGLSIYTYFFKNEGQERKKIFSRGGYQWEGVRQRKEGMSVYMVDVFVSIYKNRRMKTVEIVLRWEGEGKWENDGGGKPN
jgi:hypothetical protein